MLLLDVLLLVTWTCACAPETVAVRTAPELPEAVSVTTAPELPEAVAVATAPELPEAVAATTAPELPEAVAVAIVLELPEAVAVVTGLAEALAAAALWCSTNYRRSSTMRASARFNVGGLHAPQCGDEKRLLH